MTNIDETPADAWLREFADRVFASLPRSDQRRWAQLYLIGLLRDGPQAISRTAEAVPGRSAVQSLQQFINQSPWDWAPVRAQVALEIHERMGPRAWTAAYLVIPKRGGQAAGVDRRFVPALDRTVNSQAAVSLLLTGSAGGIPVNWRLLLSPRWIADPDLRRQARIPPSVAARSEWEELVDMVSELQQWGLPRRPLVAQWSGIPGADQLIGQLAQQDQGFLVGVDPQTKVVPHRSTRADGLRRSPAPTPLPVSRFPAGVQQRVTVVNGITGRKEVFRLSQRSLAFPGQEMASGLRLLVTGRAGQDRTPDYWITNLRDASPRELAALLQLPRVDKPVGDSLHEKLGIRAFTGRSFPGWHHYVTLTSIAVALQNFLPLDAFFN
ncbi:transposase [Actinoplanes oblitus]|uniref:Transposase n=1 Tax=Actinoplanes oblitus TaxID=3040509 RepID=A0ABY8W4R8_9ACTN|nr:transposase [Actinoplanes oblitus]WIM92831.1 transposase [Actinoplanes oblitus]